MRRALTTLLVLLLPACPGAHRAGPAADEPERTDLNPFLWRVDGPRGPSYLLGTFHLGVSASEVLPASVWDKLEACDAVIFEMNTRSLEAFGLGMLPEGETLEQQMTPEQWKELLAALKLTPESAKPLARVKVWLLYTSIVQELVPETTPIDTEVEERARAAKKRVVFLEDVREQERILERHQTVDKLLGLVRDKEKARKSMEEQIAVYKAGDADRFAELTLDPKGLDDAFLEDVVYRRNEAWIPALEQHMAKGCAFLVVGASHLVGERSVVALLRERGYTVTRIRR